MLKKAVFAALCAASVTCFAQAQSVSPLAVLKSYEQAVTIGKTDADQLKTALAEKGCGLAAAGSYEHRMVNSDNTACFGGDSAQVSFLGHDHTADNFSIQWDFKSRDKMVELRNLAEKELKSVYGIAIPYDAGNFFIKGIRFETETQNIRLLWDTYGKWLRIEVYGAGADRLNDAFGPNITALAEKFPLGQGKVSELAGFAESMGCMVADVGHPSLLTLKNKLTRECRNLNIYFKKDTDRSRIKEITFTPAKADNANYDNMMKAMGELYGTPEVIKLPTFNREAHVFKNGKTAFIVTKVRNKGKDNADVRMTSEERVVELTERPKDKDDEE